MKIIFLDIDGVMNNGDLLQHEGWDAIGEEFLQRLKTIVAATGARIVLSSTWRLSERNRDLVDQALGRHNMMVMDVTADFWTKPRGFEILEWLSRHKNTGQFAVLDDTDEAGVGIGKENFFQTDFEFGLTDEIVQRVIDHLGSAHAEIPQDEMAAV